MSHTATDKPTQGPGSQRQRGDEKRRRIFKSLHDCILARGYVKTTLADIARTADMSPSHLLYYFHGKEDILEQYFATVSVRFLEKLEAISRQQGQQQIQSLADFWFRGETSTRQEIGFMLECFGAAVHDDVLKVTKATFDISCKDHIRRMLEAGPKNIGAQVNDSAELAYALMVGLRSAVYFDDNISLEDAHRLFHQTLLTMCGYPPSG